MLTPNSELIDPKEAGNGTKGPVGRLVHHV